MRQASRSRRAMVLRVALIAAALTAPRPALAQEAATAPNSIFCYGFKKLPSGQWYALKNNPPFDLGDQKHVMLRMTKIAPQAYKLGGYDLYAVLDAKCGTPATK